MGAPPRTPLPKFGPKRIQGVICIPFCELFTEPKGVYRGAVPPIPVQVGGATGVAPTYFYLECAFINRFFIRTSNCPPVYALAGLYVYLYSIFSNFAPLAQELLGGQIFLRLAKILPPPPYLFLYTPLTEPEFSQINGRN